MLRSLVLGAALFVATPALACPMADAAAYQAAAEKVDAAGGSKVSLAVEGMHCGDCSEKVVSALKAVDGVLEVAVDYQTGTARIAFDAGKTDATKLAAAVSATGYSAKVAST